MGSGYWAKPAKRLDKEFRAVGANRRRGQHAIEYWFPDGSQRLVPRNIGPGAARQMLREVHERYGAPYDHTLTRAVRRSGAPTVRLEDVRVSTHARIRYTQMRDQGGLTMQEVLLALKTPLRVRWSDEHHTWLWIGERVAVAAAEAGGLLHVRTLLWTTEELWEQNPRP